MPDIATFQDLDARLALATGRSEDLDCSIGIFFGVCERIAGVLLWAPDEKGRRAHRHFTSSIDTVRELQEQLLPGVVWHIGHYEGRYEASIFLTPTRSFDAEAPTPALAWLRAIVATLIAKS